MTLKATVSIEWVKMVISTAEVMGVPAEQLLDMAGLPAKALDWQRWPIDYITRLWRTAEHCTENSSFGLRVGSSVTPAGISGVGFTLLSAATLRDAMTMLQKYQRVISDGGRFQMLAGETATWVVYHPQQGQLAFSPHQIEAVLAAVMRLSSWATGSVLKPARVQFSHPALGPLQDYQTVFDCPVDFEQAFSGLLLDNALLDQPLPQADAQLAQIHEQHTAARLATLEIHALSIAGIQQWLTVNMAPQVPRRADLAKALGMSERTLARRLADQGQTFAGLLDDVRQQMALQAVADKKRALPEIALSLGFAELSTFHRAFQRWTGLPPAHWRRTAVNGVVEQ